MELESRLKMYYLTAIFSVIFAAVGFGYNAWRRKVSEDNNTVRQSSFELLSLLAQTEQLVYAAHYDQNEQEGDPRKGWVKIGLIVDLSFLVNDKVEQRALALREVWRSNWSDMADDRAAVDALVEEIEAVRSEIKLTVKQLN